MTTVDPTVRTPARRELSEYLPQFQAALTQQRQFRFEQLAALAEEAANAPPPTVDDVYDQVSEILKAGARTALAEVEAALVRLRAGRYGLCERCAAPIALERLEVVPMSRYCMRCQHLIEIRSSKTGSTNRNEGP